MPAKLLKLADKSSNSGTWSPEQAIQTLLDDIKAGKIKPVKAIVMFFEEKEDGGLRPQRWFSNITRSEEVALTVLATRMAVDDWRDT